MSETHPDRLFLIQNMPISSFSLKTAGKEVDIWRIYYILFYNNLNGQQYKVGSLGKVWYGNSVYRGIYEDFFSYLLDDKNHIFSNNTPRAVYGIKYLYEIKHSLIYRLRYLQDKYLFYIDENIFIDIEKLCEKINIAMGLTTKYCLANNPNYLNRARQLFIEAEIFDCDVTKSICNLISQYVKNSLDKML